MSAKNEKARRRAARAELGISKAAAREESEFEALVRARRAAIAANLARPIVRRDSRRQVLALAGLVLVLAILALFVAGAR